MALSGATTITSVAQLDAALASHTPRVVIIALSLANEGLQESAWWSVEGIGQGYRQGLLALAQRAERAGAAVVIGGVYPHGAYTALQAQVLSETDATLKTWPYEYLDFMSTAGDADGHWKSGLDQDDGHPNDDGHATVSHSNPDLKPTP